MNKSKTNKPSKLNAVLTAALVAGILDILGAFAMYGLIVASVKPVQILQSIASGVFGKAAFANGVLMPVLGLLFHFLIALIFTFFYFLVYPYLPLLQRNKIVSGILYGICIWVVMNLVVLPLSYAGQGAFTIKGVLIGILLLVLLVGMPVALLAHRFYRPEVNKRN